MSTPANRHAERRLLEYGRPPDVDRLRLAGCACVYDASAPDQLEQLLQDAGASDTLTVVALDRLGLTRDELVELASDLTAAEIGLRSLDDHLDTMSGFAGPVAVAVFTALARVAHAARDIDARATSRRRHAQAQNGPHNARGRPADRPAQTLGARCLPGARSL